MRLLFLFFTLLLGTCARAQNIVNLTDSTYAVVTVEVEETGNLTRTITDTLELGTMPYVHDYLQVQRRKLRAEYNRLSLRLRTLNAERQDRKLLQLAESVGFPLDSLTNERLMDRVLPDTFTLVVPASLVPVELLADFTTDLNPTDSTYTLTLARFVNNRGIHRVRSVGTAGNWRVNANSTTDFEIANPFGPGTTINLIELRRTDRRARFIDRRSTVDPGGDYPTVIATY